MKKRNLIAIYLSVVLFIGSIVPVYAQDVEIEDSVDIGTETTESESMETESLGTEVLSDEVESESDNADIFDEPKQDENDNADVFDDPEQGRSIEQSALENGDVMVLSAPEQREVKAYGIDVSSWNGVIDWQKVKKAGVEFAIIRIGYRGYGTGRIVLDDTAIGNLEGAQNAGIKIGAYFFSTAINEQEAIEEAQFTLDIIKNYNITYPVVYDCEGYDDPGYRIYNLSKSIRTNNALAFLNYVESNGYEGMMYSSSSHFTGDNKWEISRIEPYYDVWVAQYWLGHMGENGDYVQYPSYASLGDRLTAYMGEYRIWQFSSEGIVDGINGYVDLDVEYYLAETEDEPSGEGDKVTAMYRLYNPNSGEHFYTKTISEKKYLVSVGWNYEGIGWYAPVTGEPIYRLYNPNVGDHHYTRDVDERDYLVSVGWNYEGIGWYSDTSESVPLHRLYNPNAVTGSHHYTITVSERDKLISLGWRYEGVGWYGSEKE